MIAYPTCRPPAFGPSHVTKAQAVGRHVGSGACGWLWRCSRCLMVHVLPMIHHDIALKRSLTYWGSSRMGGLEASCIVSVIFRVVSLFSSSNRILIGVVTLL